LFASHKGGDIYLMCIPILFLVYCEKYTMYTTLTFIILVGISVASGLQLVNPRLQSIQRIVPNLDQTKAATDLCPTCINEAVAVINVMLNAILDEGIIATCGDLCGIVTNKTGSKTLGDICDVVCDAYGIDEFVKALVTFDIDPIWYCELAKLCPSKKNPFLVCRHISLKTCIRS
jgi:hypothetical protein